jgi:site-specific recombinase XerD
MLAATAPEPRIDPLLRRYLDMLSAEKNLSRYTVRNYAADLQHLLAYLAERDADPLGITRPIFRTYLASMIGAGVAQGSIVRRVSTARSFYRWLRFAGHVADDPLANVALPKKPRRLPRALSLGDVTSVIVAADGEKPSELRDRALLEVMYGAGVRVSEAAALDLGHVDLRQMSLLVHGKGNKERLVVIGEPARAAIERYLQVRGKLAKGPGTALFLNRDGGRLSQRRIQLVVRKYARKAGLDARVHPHLLRHTFATHLLDGGAELRVVQELMGHASPNTTQIYLHVTEERQRKEVERSLDGIAEIEAARRSRKR